MYRRSLFSDWAARFQLAATIGLVLFFYMVSAQHVTMRATRMQELSTAPQYHDQ